MPSEEIGEEQSVRIFIHVANLSSEPLSPFCLSGSEIQTFDQLPLKFIEVFCREKVVRHLSDTSFSTSRNTRTAGRVGIGTQICWNNHVNSRIVTQQEFLYNKMQLLENVISSLSSPFAELGTIDQV
jgi:hypothetical protein